MSNVQPQSFQPGPGGPSPAASGGFSASSSQHPELPMPQISDTPPALAPISPSLPPPSADTASATRPIEYWLAEVEQILNQPGQNPKSRADAIVAIKRQYQQEILGLNVPGGSGIRP